MRCDDYGAFGLAWKSAANLRGSYERAERYARLLTSVSTYEVRDTPEGTCLHLRREGERRLGLRLSNEATLASLASISQEVSTARFQPLAVYLKHPAPGSASAHERHFGCPVHFGTDRDALLLSKETLLTPNRLGDHGTSRFFDAHLEAELTRLEDETSLDSRVRALVSRSLSEGLPRISEVARRLGMSGRTLQRRLSERGHSFNALVDESRRDLAERLLRQTGYSLAEVAFLTGFSEQSAFTRAFKRWAGETPRSFRARAQSPPA
jgi:AraC-like DNA-binding protein